MSPVPARGLVCFLRWVGISGYAYGIENRDGWADIVLLVWFSHRVGDPRDERQGLRSSAMWAVFQTHHGGTFGNNEELLST